MITLRRAAELAANIEGFIMGPEPAEYEGNYYTCPKCSQLVDRRKLGEVLHHEVPGHKPIPPDA